MEQIIKKIGGWVLLIAGLAVIFWSIDSSFNIFTAKAAPPEIFKIEQKKNQVSGSLSSPAELQEQIGQIVGEQLKGILPENSLPAILNLISWSIFASFLVFAGVSIAGLGIKMLRQ
jgi:hypothetical protein